MVLPEHLIIRREEMEEPLSEEIMLRDIFYQYNKRVSTKPQTTIVGVGKEVEGKYTLETRQGYPYIGNAIINDHSLEDVEATKMVPKKELDELIRYLNPEHRKNLELERKAPQSKIDKFS